MSNIWLRLSTRWMTQLSTGKKKGNFLSHCTNKHLINSPTILKTLLIKCYLTTSTSYCSYKRFGITWIIVFQEIFIFFLNQPPVLLLQLSWVILGGGGLVVMTIGIYYKSQATCFYALSSLKSVALNIFFVLSTDTMNVETRFCHTSKSWASIQRKISPSCLYQVKLDKDY